MTADIAEFEKVKNAKTKELNDVDGCIGLTQQLRNHEDTYATKFWAIKQRLDNENSPLLKALSGVLGSKERFKERVITENAANA